MNIYEIETCQAISVEQLLNQKVDAFFTNAKVEVLILQASANKKSTTWKQICSIEALVSRIRENIAIGQLKRALKLMIVLDVLMKKLMNA